MPINDSSEILPETLQGFAGLRLSSNQGASAFIATQGAQVLSWRAVDGKERLYLSSRAEGIKPGQRLDQIGPALRGGAPVCFPQFSDRGPLLKHGFARGMLWQREAASHGVHFSLVDNALTTPHWPHAFRAQVSVTLARHALTIALAVTNRGAAPCSFTCALHTYLAVDHIQDIRLQGLQNIRYQDATAGSVELMQQEELLAFPAEVDRVYLSAPHEILLIENKLPSLSIQQTGFADTVVWNPGPEKARSLPDFPDDDWLHMLCVEAAQVAKPILLEPGQAWRGTQTLTLVDSNFSLPDAPR